MPEGAVRLALAVRIRKAPPALRYQRWEDNGREGRVARAGSDKRNNTSPSPALRCWSSAKTSTWDAVGRAPRQAGTEFPFSTPRLRLPRHQVQATPSQDGVLG